MAGSVWRRIAAAAVIAAVAAGCSASAASAQRLTGAATTLTTRTPATAATKVIVYEPFTGSGAIAPGIEVAGKPSGADCYIGSLASPRRDAFRCITERNLLIDPCFLDPVGPPRLACPQGDDTSRVVLLTPRRPFPTLANHGSATATSGFPWLVRLTNGQLCAFNTGATAYYRSIGRANWGCPDGWGWGTIHRNGRHWTMAYSSGTSVTGRAAPRLTEIPIAAAWF
jgi:hypothetical protein